MAKKKSKKDKVKGKGAIAAVKAIRKKHGKGSIIYGSEKLVTDMECVSTGSFSLDCALGGRGIPFSRIVEIFGPESSGKTTLALHLLANAQKKVECGFVDMEHAIDPSYADSLGVNIKELLLSQPNHAEQALNIVEELILHGIRFIVIDSVAALVPKAELEGEMGDQQIGLQARIMGKALRKLTPLVDETKSIVLFINQIRDKIGGYAGTTTPGGKALKFYATVRIDIRRISTDKEKNKAVANKIQAKVVKSKICSPFRVAKFPIVFGKGIDRRTELFDWGKELKVIKRKGSVFSFGDIKGKGKKAFFKALKKDKKEKREFAKVVKRKILKAME